jgi:three-Cys-motif partner protein
MGQARYRTASDGHSARLAPSWTEEKLAILACYLHGFALACKRHPSGWYALDLFAGVGLNFSETTGAEIRGSPLVVLAAGPPLARTVVLCERSARALPGLTARVTPYGDRARVFARDANSEIADMLALVPRDAPAFAFLDPEGSELAWTTVNAIAGHKPKPQRRVEQLILLPTDMGFVRTLPLEKHLSETAAAKITAMYGHDRWRAIYDRRRAGAINPEAARTEYVQLYAQGLRELGYEHVQERQITKEGAGGRAGSPMYFLIHASDHDAGERIMGHCFDKKHIRPGEQLGQEGLFHVPVAPRQRRVSRADQE